MHLGKFAVAVPLLHQDRGTSIVQWTFFVDMSILRIIISLCIEKESAGSIDLRESTCIYFVYESSIFADLIFEASFGQSELWLSFENVFIIVSVCYWLIECLLSLQKLWNILVDGFRMIITKFCVKLARTSFGTFVKAWCIDAWFVFCFHVRWGSFTIAALFIAESRYTQGPVTLFYTHQCICMRNIRRRFAVIFSCLHSTDMLQMGRLLFFCSFVRCVCSTLLNSFVKLYHWLCFVRVISHCHTCKICDIVWIVTHLS